MQCKKCQLFGHSALGLTLSIRIDNLRCKYCSSSGHSRDKCNRADNKRKHKYANCVQNLAVDDRSCDQYTAMKAALKPVAEEDVSFTDAFKLIGKETGANAADKTAAKQSVLPAAASVAVSPITSARPSVDESVTTAIALSNDRI